MDRQPGSIAGAKPMNTGCASRGKRPSGRSSSTRRKLSHHWGSYKIRDIASVEVEEWLERLKLAPSSRAKLRNQMSTVFRHGIRWGWIGQHENPITMVRCSSKRLSTPETLTAEEFRALFGRLPERERAMGIICATRRSSDKRNNWPEVGRYRPREGTGQCVPIRSRWGGGKLQDGSLAAASASR